jgi:hypothetical protein
VNGEGKPSERHNESGGTPKTDGKEPEQRGIDGGEEEPQWESETETAGTIEEIEYALREILVAHPYRRDTMDVMQRYREAMDILEEKRTRQCGPREDLTMWTQQVGIVERVIAGLAEDVVQDEDRMTELRAIQKAADRGLPATTKKGYVTCKLVNGNDWAWVMSRAGHTNDLCLAATSLWGFHAYGIAQTLVEQPDRWN